MKQEQTQEQQLSQSLRQTQSITQQQLLQAQLTEMPMAQLMERIRTEMDDNPALESPMKRTIGTTMNHQTPILIPTKTTNNATSAKSGTMRSMPL